MNTIQLWSDGTWGFGKDVPSYIQFRSFPAEYEMLDVPKDWTMKQINNWLLLRQEIGEGVWLKDE